jgi:hypothetical protein
MSSQEPSMQFRIVKALDISYLTVIFFTFGFIISMILDKHFGKFNSEEADKKSTLRLLVEIVLHVCLLGVIIYAVRNIVEKIPSPFEGKYGFQHKKLKELGNASVFIFFLMFYQKHLQEKMNYVYKRLSN